MGISMEALLSVLVSKKSRQDHFWVTCSAVAEVFLGELTFLRPALFDLELEWTVGVGGGERARRLLPPPVYHTLQFVKLRKANLDASYQKVEWSCKN